VPTLAEAGVPDMEVPVWMALFAPAGTPPAIVARLQKEVARAVRTPEVQHHFATMGMQAVGGTSAELAAVVARDLAKYKAVAAAANIHND
jgi:tripartite-type tricarboxylate transporter receptor subunit TctC